MVRLPIGAFTIAVPLGLSIALVAPLAGAQSETVAAPIHIDAQPGGTPAAAEPNANVIQLRDGTVVRGPLTDLRPGQYVIVALPEGPRTIAWLDIMHAEGPSFPGGYTTTMYVAPVGEAATFAPTDYLHPGPGRVPLVVESSGPTLAVAESYTAGVGQGYGGIARAIGRRLCDTPCTLYVFPSRFPLQGTAAGYRTTVVNVVVPPDGVRVRLRTTPAGRYYASIGVLGGGGLVTISGLVVLMYGIIENNTVSVYGPSSGSGSALTAVGGTMIGLGAAAFVTGAVLLSVSRSGIESSSPLARRFRPRFGLGVASTGAAASLTAEF